MIAEPNGSEIDISAGKHNQKLPEKVEKTSNAIGSGKDIINKDRYQKRNIK